MEQETKAKSAITIQKTYRAYKQRLEYLKVLESVYKIQGLWLTYKLRNEYLRKKEAAICIQTKWRAVKLASVCHREYVLMKRSTIAIQSNWRAVVCRRNFLRLRDSSIKIQRWWRDLCLRKEADHQAKVLKAVSTIQRRWRETALMKRVRYEYCVCRGAAIVIQERFRAWQLGKSVCSDYQRLKSTTILLQAQVRMLQQRSRYLYQRELIVKLQSHARCLLAKQKFKTLKIKQETKVRSVITIQKTYRAYKQRREYLKVREASQKIQGAWRSHKLRCEYMRKREAAICIQTKWRAVKLMSVLHRAYKAKKIATIAIQSNWRAVVCRRNFLRLRDSSIKIQRWWRDLCLRKQADHQAKVLMAAISIQRRWRETLLTKSLRYAFCVSRGAAMVIQERFHAWQLGKSVRSDYQSLKSTTILLQAQVRMRQQRSRYLHQRELIVKLQNHARGLLTRRKFEDLQRRHYAAKCIQSYYRSYKQQRLQKEKHIARLKELQHIVLKVQHHLSVIRLQRAFRRHLALKKYQENMTAVIIVQRWFRAYLTKLRYRRTLVAIDTIQTATRRWLQRRQLAASVIQKAVRRWLVRRVEERKHAAASIIQAYWTGYKCRKQSRSKKVRQIRQRIEEANSNATEAKKLGNRTTSALDCLLQCRQISLMLESLMHLETASRLSPHCCERLATSGVAKTLFDLMSSCNRSVPHMDLIKYSTMILINLAKHNETRDYVFDVEDSIIILVDKLQIFLGKGAIFTKTCTLLCILAQDEKTAKEMVNVPQVTEKLQSIQKIVNRRFKLKETYDRNRQPSGPLAVNKKKKPKFKPDWDLAKNGVQELEDALPAINLVLTMLNLKSK